MAHPEQQDFIKRLSQQYQNLFDTANKVLEVGSQNINGTVRPFFANAKEYIGIDLGAAQCVDWVIPGELIELPDAWADITISTECLEHCRDWGKVLVNMIRITKPNGLVIFTCATLGRPTHGTIDSDECSSPFTTSYYKNLCIDEIADKVQLGAYFSLHGFEVNTISSDLYFWGVRLASSIRDADSFWEPPLDRLARAQGQLGQAAKRHASIQAQLDKSEAKLIDAVAKAEAAQIAADRMHQQLKEIRQSHTWRLTRPARKIVDHAKKSLRILREHLRLHTRT